MSNNFSTNDMSNDFNEIFNDLIDNIDFEDTSGNSNEAFSMESINDNFLNLADQYYNESFISSITSLNDDLNQITDHDPQLVLNMDYEQNNISHPHILIVNQSEENVSLNAEIKNKQYFSKYNIKNHTYKPVSSDEFIIDQSTKHHQHIQYEKQTSTICHNAHNTGLLMSNEYYTEQAKKKDENFHNKLISLLDTDDIKKLSDEMYTLEYYRSCNRLLAIKSRPLANLRQTNKDAERKHKELIDLNKKCRSIIRKFKNGPLTIDTLFKWNEQRSLDGPMSCSICRCNKFFKRPGSIANHIYRVHGKILQEALKSGELNNVIKDRDKPKSVNQSKFFVSKQTEESVTQTKNQCNLLEKEISIFEMNEKNNISHFNKLTLQTISSQEVLLYAEKSF